MTNRLRLDFSLSTNSERREFLENYLAQDQFTSRPPTEDELEMMANYLLWGKDPKTGLNAQQEGICQIDTKHGTWDKDGTVESLDGLLENPVFNEATLRPIDAVPMKVKREVFSRSEALKEAPDYLKQSFVDLFRNIDELDLRINYYDLAHGKRKNPIRPELAKLFSEEEHAEAESAAAAWNQFKYLKMRHQLVEMRQEQYTLRDSYRQTILPGDGVPHITIVEEPDIDAEIEVLPLGVMGRRMRPFNIFVSWDQLIPQNYGEAALKAISDFYWMKQKYEPAANQFYIDFRELEHVYQLFMTYFELEGAIDEEKLNSGLSNLLDTLKFYIERAELCELQQEILDLKMKKVKNEDIAHHINKKYGKTYTPNYISTIFRQRIIPKINEAAAFHEKIVSNLFFGEEFKTCPGCGHTLLRCSENFTRKSRSKDGYTSRCKKCEKAARKK